MQSRLTGSIVQPCPVYDFGHLHVGLFIQSVLVDAEDGSQSLENQIQWLILGVIEVCQQDLDDLLRVRADNGSVDVTTESNISDEAFLLRLTI
jgi:hypothetical protein